MRIVCVLMFALVLGVPRGASACECIGVQGPFLNPGNKGIVATGRVVNIRVGNSTASPAADVEITEGFLNAKAGARIRIYGVSNNCGYLLREGEEYVLATDFVEAPDSFWGNLPPRSHAVTSCGRTKVLKSSEGQKMLATIRLEMRRLRR